MINKNWVIANKNPVLLSSDRGKIKRVFSPQLIKKSNTAKLLGTIGIYCEDFEITYSKANNISVGMIFPVYLTNFSFLQNPVDLYLNFNESLENWLSKIKIALDFLPKSENSIIESINSGYVGGIPIEIFTKGEKFTQFKYWIENGGFE